jgi:hypothetical protein
MLVKIKRPRTYWLSPYKLCDWLFGDDCDYDGVWVQRVVKVLNPVAELVQTIALRLESKPVVHIDPWDTWSMHGTLSQIILPMLRQLKTTKHGAPYVDDSDVPESLSSKTAKPKDNEWDTDSNHFDRWDWVLDEMIWAFEQLQPDSHWEDRFTSGELDIAWIKLPNGYSQMTNGPKHTWQQDEAAIAQHQQRINRGLKLFAKYYEALWD